MATAAQVLANQSNSQHSTGPKTEEGRAAAALNNFRHGLAGKWVLTADEDPADFEALHQSLAAEHQPATPTEVLLVESMAQHYWLGQRALRLQSGCMEDVQNVNHQQLSLYIRYQSTHGRAFFKCLNDLLKLRKERAKAEIGSESQKAEAAQANEVRKQEIHEARTRAIHAKAAHQELETEIKGCIEAPMPGNTRIPFGLLKSVLAKALAEVNRTLQTNPEIAKNFEDAA